jgi:hypothetical protein
MMSFPNNRTGFSIWIIARASRRFPDDEERSPFVIFFKFFLVSFFWFFRFFIIKCVSHLFFPPCLSRADPIEHRALITNSIFRVHSVDVLRESIRTEDRRLGNQIERCNPYNSSVIETKSLIINVNALRVAYIALAISGLSFLLTTLSVLKLI